MNANVVADLAVLIITNHATSREQFERWLTSPRVHLFHATTAEAALRRAQERTFDLVVFDCGVDPLGMEGVESVISQEFRSTPKIVICSPDDLARVPTATQESVHLLATNRVTEEAFFDALRQALPEAEALLPLVSRPS
ncbi:MAG: response regulator [Verrucomicrobia bacterium]|nr:response regulator [Verrucomicrobiota bacterium]